MEYSFSTLQPVMPEIFLLAATCLILVIDLFLSERTRLLTYGLSLAAVGIGFLFILSDDRRQGWHDKIAGTCVIYSWKARQSPGLARSA